MSRNQALKEFYSGDNILKILQHLNLTNCFIGNDCSTKLKTIGARFFKDALESKKRFAILPFNLDDNHWVLCFFIFDEKKKDFQMLYFDPLSNEEKRASDIAKIEDFIKSTLPPEDKTTIIKDISIAIQQDNVNCGPILIETAATIARYFTITENIKALIEDEFVNLDKIKEIIEKDVAPRFINQTIANVVRFNHSIYLSERERVIAASKETLPLRGTEADDEDDLEEIFIVDASANTNTKAEEAAREPLRIKQRAFGRNAATAVFSDDLHKASEVNPNAITLSMSSDKDDRAVKITDTPRRLKKTSKPAEKKALDSKKLIAEIQRMLLAEIVSDQEMEEILESLKNYLLGKKDEVKKIEISEKAMEIEVDEADSQNIKKDKTYPFETSDEEPDYTDSDEEDEEYSSADSDEENEESIAPQGQYELPENAEERELAIEEILKQARENITKWNNHAQRTWSEFDEKLKEEGIPINILEILHDFTIDTQKDFDDDKDYSASQIKKEKDYDLRKRKYKKTSDEEHLEDLRYYSIDASITSFLMAGFSKNNIQSICHIKTSLLKFQSDWYKKTKALTKFPSEILNSIAKIYYNRRGLIDNIDNIKKFLDLLKTYNYKPEEGFKEDSTNLPSYLLSLTTIMQYAQGFPDLKKLKELLDSCKNYVDELQEENLVKDTPVERYKAFVRLFYLIVTTQRRAGMPTEENLEKIKEKFKAELEKEYDILLTKGILGGAAERKIEIAGQLQGTMKAEIQSHETKLAELTAKKAHGLQEYEKHLEIQKEKSALLLSRMLLAEEKKRDEYRLIIQHEDARKLAALKAAREKEAIVRRGSAEALRKGKQEIRERRKIESEKKKIERDMLSEAQEKEGMSRKEQLSEQTAILDQEHLDDMNKLKGLLKIRAEKFDEAETPSPKFPKTEGSLPPRLASIVRVAPPQRKILPMPPAPAIFLAQNPINYFMQPPKQPEYITTPIYRSPHKKPANLIKEYLLKIEHSPSLKGLFIPIEFSQGKLAECIIVRVKTDGKSPQNIYFAFYLDSSTDASEFNANYVNFFGQLSAEVSSIPTNPPKIKIVDIGKFILDIHNNFLSDGFKKFLQILNNFYDEHGQDLYKEFFHSKKLIIENLIGQESSCKSRDEKSSIRLKIAKECQEVLGKLTAIKRIEMPDKTPAEKAQFLEETLRQISEEVSQQEKRQLSGDDLLDGKILKKTKIDVGQATASAPKKSATHLLEETSSSLPNTPLSSTMPRISTLKESREKTKLEEGRNP